MDKITSLNRSTSWDQFKFYHDEGQKYSVLLPEGGKLYLSSHTIFILRENKSVLLSPTKVELTADPNVLDFSKSEYSTEEIIQFFYLITFSYDDVTPIEDFTNAIMLAHLYTPEIAQSLASTLYCPVPDITTNIEDFRYFWKVIKIKQLTNAFSNSGMDRMIFNLLRCIPHTLYSLDNTVDIRQLIDDAKDYLAAHDIIHEIGKMWENKDVNGLNVHEIKLRNLVQTNDEGVTCLRIPVVAEHLGLRKPTLTELLHIGRIAASYYRDTHGNGYERINWNIDGKIIQINRYELIHYGLLAETIKAYYSLQTSDDESNDNEWSDDECLKVT